MKKSTRTGLYLAGLLSLPAVTACGDMQQPAAAAEASKKKVSTKDAASMAKLMKDIKSGFGERNPTVSSVSFDGPR